MTKSVLACSEIKLRSLPSFFYIVAFRLESSRVFLVLGKRSELYCASRTKTRETGDKLSPGGLFDARGAQIKSLSRLLLSSFLFLFLVERICIRVVLQMGTYLKHCRYCSSIQSVMWRGARSAHVIRERFTNYLIFLESSKVNFRENDSFLFFLHHIFVD